MSGALEVTLDRPEQLVALKILGSARYRLQIHSGEGGEGSPIVDAIDLSKLGPGWHTLPIVDAAQASRVMLTFEMIGDAPTSIPELELWAAGSRAATDVDLRAALPTGFIAIASTVTSGEIGAERCASFPITMTRSPTQFRRAHLVYEGAGIAAPFMVRRSINEAGTTGGAWLDRTETSRTFVEEIDVSLLRLGANNVELCLPREATRSSTISSIRIVGELDRGTQLANRVMIDADALAGSHRAALLASGKSEINIGAGQRIAIDLERLIAPDALIIAGRASAPASVACRDRKGASTRALWEQERETD